MRARGRTAAKRASRGRLFVARRWAAPRGSRSDNLYMQGLRGRLPSARAFDTCNHAVTPCPTVSITPGGGHSWNQPFFCAGEPEANNATAGPMPSRLVDAAAPQRATAANIALTTLRPLSIDVNASDESVWVDAPVIVADLLEVNEGAAGGWARALGPPGGRGGSKGRGCLPQQTVGLLGHRLWLRLRLRDAIVTLIPASHPHPRHQYLAAHVTEDAPAGWTIPAFPWFVYQAR